MIFRRTSNAEAMAHADPKSCISKTRECANLKSLFLLSVHLLASLLFIVGFASRRNFQNGDECEMTYSMREFVEITNPFESSFRLAKKYKLYKFFDRRDPRYQSLIGAKQPLADDLDWCGSSHTKVKLVLFIPGHWGSYTQSRSLGAHGLKLTGKANDASAKRVIDALRNGSLSGDALNEESFVYEVLAIDFAGQGAALHGQFLRSQSEYVGASVKHISRVCNIDSITLVGHSMGGIVARLVPVLHPEVAHLVRNIITLASPHSNPNYSFDYSISRVYEELQRGWKEETLVVSVSTGLKDEMIEPNSSLLISNSSFSILATEMLRNGEFGMDHQAITWCFDVLHSLRSVIWAISKVDNEDVLSRLKLIRTLLGAETSLTNFLLAKSNLNAKFGFVHTSIIETGMFYNIPHLLSLFCILAWLRFSFPSECDMYFLFFTAMCGWCFCDINKGSTLVLTLVANFVHTLLSATVPIGFCKDETLGRFIVIYCVVFTSVGVLLFQLGAVLDKKSLHHTETCIFLFLMEGIFCCIFLVLGFSQSLRRKRDLSFVSLAFVGTTVAGIGPFSLILWGGRPEAWNWQSLILILFSVSLYHSQQRCRSEQSLALATNSVLSLSFGISVVCAGNWLLARGHAYRLVYVIVAVAPTDAIATRIATKERRPEKDL